jgi:hypothetical protein
MRTDGKTGDTDITKLIVAFRNFSNAPKNTGNRKIQLSILNALNELAMLITNGYPNAKLHFDQAR